MIDAGSLKVDEGAGMMLWEDGEAPWGIGLFKDILDGQSERIISSAAAEAESWIEIGDRDTAECCRESCE